MSARIRLALVALAAVCFCGFGPAPLAAQDDALLGYLTRLGLGELRTRHLERNLDQAPANKRDALARQLADVYAERLLSVASDVEAFNALAEKLARLRATYPAIDTPKLAVILLQARYQAAEAELLKWIEDARDVQSRQTAVKVLHEIAPQLIEKQEQLGKEIETRTNETENLKEPAKTQAEAEISRLQIASMRAAFFGGWGNYYLAVLENPGQSDRKELEIARDAFLSLLELAADSDYDKLEAEALGLESIWRARAVIGLGLAHAARKEFKKAHAAFSWLTHPATPIAVRDQASFWELQGYLWPRYWDEALTFARREIDQFAGEASAGKNSFCVALVKAGFGTESAGATQRQLGELGIRGLAKLKQFETLGQLVEKYQIAATTGDSFYLKWLRGRRQFFAAEKSKKPEDYRAAADELRSAIGDAQAMHDPAAAAQARFHLAWCHFRLSEYELAARLFHEIIPTLKEVHAESASQAAWMEFGSYQILAGQDKKYIPAAVEAAQALKRDFPESPNAARIDVLLAKLRQAGGANDESISVLEKIKPSEPSYLAAQFELTQLYHQQWSKGKQDASSRTKLAQRVTESAEHFLAAAKEPSDSERRLKAALLAMDVLAAEANVDWSLIGGWLRRIQEDAARVSEAQPIMAEYHYRRLQMAQQKKDAAAIAPEAAWLSEHASGSPYELPALIIVARQADAAVAQAPDGEKPARRAAAIDVYRRLAPLVGEDSQTIAASRNALAANSKLASYLEQDRKWPEAAERLERLVGALPSDKSYLRRAGLAWFHAGKFAEALPHWRKLLSGLPAGNDEWFEAKYYHLACLHRTSPEDAQQSWQQFKLLYPEVKNAAWSDKFTALGKQFE